MTNLYDTLGVEQTADPASLRRAYRRLARKYHPDINSDPGSHDLMARINEAFETLIDPGRRMEYDALLAGGLRMDAAEPQRHEAPQPVVVRLRHRIRAHRTPIYGLSFVPGRDQLLSTAFDNEMAWWDPVTGAAVRKIKLEAGTVSTVRAFADGRVVTAGSAENQVSLYTIRDKGATVSKSAVSNWVCCLAVAPDGSSVATGSVQKEFAVMAVATGDRLVTRTDHTASVTAVAWSFDGQFVATGSSDASVKLRHSGTGAVLHTFSGVRSAVTALAFSPDGRFLAVAAVDYSVRVFRLSDGFLTKVMFGHSKPIETLAFHPNGWLFASGGRDGSVNLWNAAQGIGQLHLEASHRPISNVVFNEDGSLMAASGLDKTIRVWEIQASS